MLHLRALAFIKALLKPVKANRRQPDLFRKGDPRSKHVLLEATKCKDSEGQPTAPSRPPYPLPAFPGKLVARQRQEALGGVTVCASAFECEELRVGGRDTR